MPIVGKGKHRVLFNIVCYLLMQSRKTKKRNTIQMPIHLFEFCDDVVNAIGVAVIVKYSLEAVGIG